MDSSKFHLQADKFLTELAEKIESKIETNELEYLQGVLTLELVNGSIFVLNKHEPTKQIWLSSPKSGAHKFEYSEKEETWINKSGEKLINIIYQEVGI